jgi:hypothetical protein
VAPLPLLQVLLSLKEVGAAIDCGVSSLIPSLVI